MKSVIVAFLCFFSFHLKSQDRNNFNNKLFPVYGVTPGETTVAEIRSRRYFCDMENDDGVPCTVRSLTFWDYDMDGIVESVNFVNTDGVPNKWMKYLGFDFNLSYNQWMKLLEQHGFSIEIITEPNEHEPYSDRETFNAELKAISKTGSTEITFNFSMGNDHGEGSTRESIRSLYGISVEAKSEEKDVYTSVPFVAEANPRKLFPVYDFTIGETTVAEIQSRKFYCETDSAANNTSCDVYGLDLWDYENDGVLESIYFVYGNQMPAKWEDNFGFSWDLSYNEWTKILTDLGFVIEVKSPPQTVVYEGRNTLAATLIARSEMQNIQLELDFNYGNSHGEGYAITSARSLYSMTINVSEH
jgi:hypothetical protein